MFGFRNEFITKVKKKILNAVGSHCVIHRELCISGISIKDKLATIIRAVKYIKASAVNTKLCTKLCKDMDSNHETSLFSYIRSVFIKSNMLARVYKIKGELRLFFEAHGDTRFFFSQPNQKSFISRWQTSWIFSKR